MKTYLSCYGRFGIYKRQEVETVMQSYSLIFCSFSKQMNFFPLQIIPQLMEKYCSRNQQKEVLTMIRKLKIIKAQMTQVKRQKRKHLQKNRSPVCYHLTQRTMMMDSQSFLVSPEVWIYSH